MATVKLYPSTISTVLEWTTPDNAKTDDGINATTDGTRNNDHDLVGTGFDLSSIPEGSTITSVAAEVKYYVSRSRNWTGTLGVTRGGVEDKAHGITTNDEPTSYEVWRNPDLGTWTLEELQTIGVLFRVRKETALSTTWYVDYLAIVVDYTQPSYDVSGTGTVSGTGSAEGTGAKATTTAGTIASTASASASWAKQASGTGSTSSASSVSGTGVYAEYTYDFSGTGSVSATTSASGTGTKKAQAQGTATSTATVTASASRQANSQGLVASTHSLTVSGTKQASGAGANTSGQAVTSAYSLSIPTYDFNGTGSVTSQGSVNAASAKQASRTGTLSTASSLSSTASKQADGAGIVTSQTTNTASYTLDIPTYDFSGQGAITANGSTQASATKYSTSASAITHTTTIISTASIGRYSAGFITALAITTGSYTRAILYRVKSKHRETYTQGDAREVVMLPASFTVRATLSEGKPFTKRIGKKTRKVITW